MDKTIHSLNARIKEEYELVTLFVRKVGDLNRRTGEFTFCQRFRESTDLNSHGFGSGDDGRYEIKTSLSDSIIEIGSTTHTLKTVKSKNSFVFSLQRIPSIEESVTKMLEQFRTAMRDCRQKIVDVFKGICGCLASKASKLAWTRKSSLKKRLIPGCTGITPWVTVIAKWVSTVVELVVQKRVDVVLLGGIRPIIAGTP
uniref:Uncharacterized protein n=1 Tax=Magallana gigas TaxID=29159 RepID=K1QWU2_MAGGI